MKTRKEVDDLKSNWHSDPCYDLEEMPDFEEYWAELAEFAAHWKERWRQEELSRLLLKADALGCPGNVKLVKHIERLERRLAALEGE